MVNYSEIETTINGSKVEMSQYGIDRDVETPRHLRTFVYYLIELLDMDENDASDDLYGKIEKNNVNPADLEFGEYGPIGELYKDLLIRNEDIINQMVMVNWYEKIEDDEEGFEEITQFSYDPKNGEKYVHKLDGVLLAG